MRYKVAITKNSHEVANVKYKVPHCTIRLLISNQITESLFITESTNYWQCFTLTTKDRNTLVST